VSFFLIVLWIFLDCFLAWFLLFLCVVFDAF